MGWYIDMVEQKMEEESKRNKKNDLISDVVEALEKVQRWKPLYEAVLKHTGDKEQARLAILFAERMYQESNLEGKDKKSA